MIQVFVLKIYHQFFKWASIRRSFDQLDKLNSVWFYMKIWVYRLYWFLEVYIKIINLLLWLLETPILLLTTPWEKLEPEKFIILVLKVSWASVNEVIKAYFQSSSSSSFNFGSQKIVEFKIEMLSIKLKILKLI